MPAIPIDSGATAAGSRTTATDSHFVDAGELASPRNASHFRSPESGGRTHVPWSVVVWASFFILLREIAHFLRHAPEALRLQAKHSRAEFLDVVMTRADERGYGAVRSALVGGLSGRVLEIGCGTGAMFDYYGPTASVTAIEPEADFFELAVKRAEKFGKRIDVVDGNGMALAFESDSFDAVVLGLVLCSVPSVEAVLREAYRVVRPSGILRAFEHVRSRDRLAGLLMDASNPLWLRLNKQGCHWNRDPLEAMARVGFVVDGVYPFKTFETMLPAFSMIRVEAHKPARAA
jgi:SAM-dependent methyltransferase